MISLEQLIEAIEDSVVRKTVLVPDDSYYARRGDFCEDYIYHIDPHVLVEKLKEYDDTTN